MEPIFVDGLRFERPREGAPEFVKGRLGIKVADLIKFLETHGNGQEWLNADLLQSRDGQKLYFKLNTWKPEDKSPSEKVQQIRETMDKPEGDIPFN